MADPTTSPGVDAAFRLLNRWFMVPLARAGLGAWVSTPLGGAILLLRVRGRRSGLIREVPLNYLVADGAVWVMVGFGAATQWYRNLLADARVEVVLPGRRVSGTAAEVLDPDVRCRIMPALLRSTAGPALSAGLDPWRTSPPELMRRLERVPLIRIEPESGALVAGPDDPGGHAWIWRQAVVSVLMLAGVRVLAGILGRARVSAGQPAG
jgi:deazaflavin-dependent oxidoreductase (nitroreductase family)